MTSRLVQKLLAWYRAEGRALPWRASSDPYAVWVSEVMLQQTRVETVIPYYERWLQRFPTIAALAEAAQQEVLAAWEGLGYYSRARALHRAAQTVVTEHQGKLPTTSRELQKLPGIGAYTAAAVASIAFGEDAVALDGNLRRTLSRLFNIQAPLGSPESESRLAELAHQLLPPGQAGDFNQALMDLGATICTPRNPACERCPIQAHCQAYHLGVQTERPVKAPRRAVPHFTVAAAVITRPGQVLIAQRPAQGLLGGMWEFPGGKQQPGENLQECLEREIREELGVRIQVGEPFGVYEHAYTHFRVTLHAFCCQLSNGALPRPVQVADLHWAAPDDLAGFPMGKIDRQIAKRLAQAAR